MKEMLEKNDDLALLLGRKVTQIKKQGENQIAIYTDANAVVVITAVQSVPCLKFFGIEFPQAGAENDQKSEP